MEKTYLVDTRLDLRVGTYHSGMVYRDGYPLNVNVADPAFVLETVSVEHTLNCYQYSGQEAEFNPVNFFTYEVKEQGRYYAILLDDQDGEMLALLCQCRVDPETDRLYVVKNPFNSIYDRPASYIENPPENTFNVWVVMDYSFR